MSLHPGLSIGRYELRSPLGAGGMGEVYRAFDTELEREVALKFLRQADDAEKLLRFRQEAKAVTALNHPNILTIYDFGKYENCHFIVSELVTGANLREVVAARDLTLDEILDIGIETGNALAAAHAVGIVHRDIKPENIMLSPDGYVKVLDFGLAKFVGLEKNLASDADATTASLVKTKAGMLIGTVNYMSPEQLRGKAVDERADVWSLGIVLFELLTRRRPFNGESVSDVIASVLEHPLPPFSRFDTVVPETIENIVVKALEKNKERRFENARDFVAALKNARPFARDDERANVNRPPLPPKSFHSQQTVFTSPNQMPSAVTSNLSGLFIAGNRVSWRTMALAVLLSLSVVAVGGWFFFSQPLFKQPPVKQMKFERFTTSGNVTNATISPDGNFVVYVQSGDGRQSLWLRQVNETAAKELIPASSDNYGSLTFKPDGNWIYYTVFSHTGAGTLYRIPLLGDSPQPIANDVDSAIAFAPDGKTFAFIRSNPREGTNQVIVSNADGGERILSERKRPEFYTHGSRESLSWSPDGKYIACPFGKIGADGEFMTIVEISVETGEQKPLTETKWSRVGRVVWTKNADELLITAAEFGSHSFQIRRLLRASGKIQNVTNELSDFYNLSVNKDSTRLLAVIYDKTSKLYAAPGGQPNALKPLAGGNYDGIGGVWWAADNRVYYVSTESRNRDIWAVNPDGGKAQQVTFDEAADEQPSVSADGKHLVFVSSRTGAPHVWRTNLNGGEPKQLTDKGGENLPEVTPDGKFVIYSRVESRPLLWKIPVEGGAPAQLTKEPTSSSAISPDGKFIVCLTRGATLESLPLLALVSSESGEIVRTFKPAGILSSPDLPATIRWLPDSQKFAYVANVSGISNVWTQNLAGGEPKKITDFSADRIFSFDFSKDGKRIVYARGALRKDLVLMENF